MALLVRWMVALVLVTTIPSPEWLVRLPPDMVNSAFPAERASLEVLVMRTPYGAPVLSTAVWERITALVPMTRTASALAEVMDDLLEVTLPAARITGESAPVVA